jgi:hypothetical protein
MKSSFKKAQKKLGINFYQENLFLTKFSRQFSDFHQQIDKQFSNFPIDKIP